jgi:hypothetical protein
MSSIKTNPNPKLSKKHIEILKKELGIFISEESNGNNKEK